MKYAEQQLARKMRADEGKSLGDIARALGVSKSSISTWTRDIELTELQRNKLLANRRTNIGERLRNTNRERATTLRLQYQEEGKKRAQNESLLYCMGCMLFWAEGAKTKSGISFSNTDVNMLKLFVRFLKTSLGIRNQELTITVNCFAHKETDIELVHDYWVRELELEGCNIRKPSIKLTTEPIDNYGVCLIRVHNTRLTQILFGSIQAYGGFNNNMCLHNKRSRKRNQPPA